MVRTHVIMVTFTMSIFLATSSAGVTQPLWLKRKLKKLTKLVDGLEQEMEQKTGWMAQADDWMDHAKINITDNQDEVSNNAGAVDSILDGIKSMVNETSVNSVAIDTIVASVASNADGISNNDNKISSIETDVSSNAAGILNNDGKISNIVTDVSSNADGISNNAADITSNGADISDNAVEISNHDAEISSILTFVSNNNDGISNNAAAVSSNKGDISNNAAEISNTDAEISNIVTDVLSNADGISNNAAAVASNVADISNNADSISNNDAAISSIVTDVSSNNASIANNEVAISSILTDVTSNAAGISNNSAAISSNVADIVSIEDEVDAATRCTATNWEDNNHAQRWKLGSNKELENKEGVWKSDDKWIFNNDEEGLIYIENTNKNKVLQATNDGKVTKKNFVDGKAEQLWKKGNPDDEGYFTLESHSKSVKFITAISESDLEIKDHENCCTSANPCGLSQGNCGSDDECSGDLRCGFQNCVGFGKSDANCCIDGLRHYVSAECTCQTMTVSMIGNLSTSLQSSRAGDYQESAIVNGHPSWINAKNAIWFFDVFDDWVVGDIKKRGLIFRGLKTDNQGGSECPFDITATKWSFWNGTKWNSVGAGELSLHCSLAKFAENQVNSSMVALE